MKIPVQLETRSGAIIRRTIRAISTQKAASLRMKPITEPQLSTSVPGATFVAKEFLRLQAAKIPCAIVQTRDGRRLTVYRVGVKTCEQLVQLECRTMKRHTVRGLV